MTDARGRHVSGLIQENFHVLEDGQPRPIAVFHQGDAPVTLGLIVDRSQSMRQKSPALLAAVSALLVSSRPDDELFAVVFNDRASFALPGSGPFTRDTRRLAAALVAVRAEGQTALYDAVAEGLHRLQLGHSGKRTLIVVSDGGDNASRQTYAQILAFARQSDAVIYGIGLLGGSKGEEDSAILSRLCQETGGRAYFPRTADEIAAMSTRVARDFREQYTLGFAPGMRSDGPAFRRIEVKVSAPAHGRLRVRTRSGYLLAGDRP